MIDGVALADLGELDELAGIAAEGGPVALGIVDERGGEAEPDEAASAAEPAVEEQRGDLAAFAGAGAVPNHVSAPEAHGLGMGAGRDGLGFVPFFADDVFGVQVAGMGFGGENDLFELGVREDAARDGGGGERGTGRGDRWADGRHRGALDERGGVARDVVDADALRLPGQEAGAGVGGADGGVGDFGRGVRELLDGTEIGRREGCGPVGRASLGGSAHRLRGIEQIERDGPCGAARGDVGLDAGDEVGRRRGVEIGREAMGVGLARVIEDGQAAREGGAAALVEGALDGGGEDDARRRGDAGEGVVPGVGVGGAGVAGDGDEAPAGLKRAVGGGDVDEIDAEGAGLYVRGPRERGVHEDDAWMEVGEEVPDVLGVVGAQVRVGEEKAQELEAGVAELVEVDGDTEGVGEDCEHAGAGARLEHDVGGAQACGAQCGVDERERGGELLVGELLVAAPGVGGLEGGEALEQRDHVERGRGAAPHGLGEALEEEDDRGLGRLVGIAPAPVSGRVGAAERGVHRVAEKGGGEGGAAFEVCVERASGVHERMRALRSGAGNVGHRCVLKWGERGEVRRSPAPLRGSCLAWVMPGGEAPGGVGRARCRDQAGLARA